MNARVWLVLTMTTAASVAVGAASKDSATVAAGVLGVPEVRAEIAAAVARSTRPGTATDLAQALVERDEVLWNALRTRLEGALETELDPTSLATIATASGADPAAAWEAHRQVLAPTLRKVLEAERDGLTGFGCSIGLLAGPADAALARARAAGKNPELSALTEPLAGLLPRTRETCDCVLERFPEGWLEEAMKEPTRRSEVATALAELIKSGACPDPFAKLPGAK